MKSEVVFIVETLLTVLACSLSMVSLVSVEESDGQC